MHRNRPGAIVLAAALAAAIAVLLLVPTVSPAGLVEGTKNLVERATGADAPDGPSGGGGSQGGGGSGGGGTSRTARPQSQPSPSGNLPNDPGGYQPPLHGAAPHGQGTGATVDIAPDTDRPLTGDPAAGEDIVLGRSRGENIGSRREPEYQGHVTVLGLLGNEIVGVETERGERSNGPFAPLQDILDSLCDGSAENICLSLLRVDSETTNRGSRNSFQAVGAEIGPGGSLVGASAVESEGNIEHDNQCQTATGRSEVADANLIGVPNSALLTADVIGSSSTSAACNNGNQTVSNDSNVVNLNSGGLPIPAPGCADGTPDSEFDLIGLVSAVCNADDVNGDGEDVVQTQDPYGVREGLTIWALTLIGDLLKATTAASESHALAPPRDDGGRRCPDGSRPPCDDGGKKGDGKRPHRPRKHAHRHRNRPECSDGVDNDGDGFIDLADPDCDSGRDDSEAGAGAGLIGVGGGGGAAECQDGIDNDGDGLIDFGSDPQCSSPADDSEADGVGVGGPAECDDGRDNDGDGKIDFPDDPQCESKTDDSEADGALAATGADLLLLLLLGGLALAGGMSLRSAVGRWQSSA